jgi:hypothetical protein
MSVSEPKTIKSITYQDLDPLLGNYDGVRQAFASECDITLPNKLHGRITVNPTSRNIVIHNISEVMLAGGKGRSTGVSPVTVSFSENGETETVEACLLPITVMFRSLPLYKDDANRFVKLSPALFNPQGWKVAEEMSRISGKPVNLCYSIAYGNVD